MKKLVYVSAAIVAIAFFSSCRNSNTPEKSNGQPQAESSSATELIGQRTEAVDLNKYSTVVYVNSSAEKEGDGSKSSPFKTIIKAMDKVTGANRNNPVAILVSAGNYTESEITAIPWVDLLGGFNPENWERDVILNKSVINGIEGKRIMVGANNFKVDGFNFIGAIYKGKGAVIYCDGVSPTISNNLFEKNKTQKPDNWHPKFWHETANDGGALYFTNGADPVITNNVFAGNKTENGRGGAIACAAKCQPVIRYNVFVDNMTGLNDPARSSDGGAISIFNKCNATIENNYIVGNTALAKNDAGGIFIALWSSAHLENNVLVDNEAGDDAGAIFVGGQEHRYDGPLDPMPSKKDFYVTIVKNTIIGNRNSSMNSGVMRFTMESRGEVSNNVTAFNNGVYFQRSEVAVKNNLFLDNFLFVETKEDLKPGSIIDNVIWGDYVQEVEAIVKGNKIRGKNLNNLNFANDGKELAVISTTKTKGAYNTEVLVTGLNARVDEWVGRVAKSGAKYGIIKSSTGNTLSIWGNFESVDHLSILPTYTIK